MSVKNIMCTAICAMVLCIPVMGAQYATVEASPPNETTNRLARECDGRNGWNDVAPPATIFANVHYVGTCGITVLLITSDEGHILIDGATDLAADQIISNIEALGFRAEDIHTLLISHEHIDHAGGISKIQQRTGARLLVREDAKGPMESGIPDPDDPQASLLPPFPPAHVNAIIADGDVIGVGSLALTAHATAGHTSGSTSWSWTSCAGEDCRRIVYGDSMTAVSADGYRFSDHPERINAFRKTFASFIALRCDILLTPHPGASALFDRLSGKSPIYDAGGCADYAAKAEKKLDERLSKEKRIKHGG